MVQMAFCKLSHTFHKHDDMNVSQHVFVILLRGILTSPLSEIEQKVMIHNMQSCYNRVEHKFYLIQMLFQRNDNGLRYLRYSFIDLC